MSAPAVRSADANERACGFRRLAPPPGGPTPDGRPLGGVRFALKENIDVVGFPTQAGLGVAPPPATADAPCVARLRAAGGVLAGQTAMDEAAFGGTTDNPHYGRTPNPRRDDVTPGGSSGGSAAAVASGAVRLALGTDTLGSVRIPAAYCGIVGFKPTFGRIDVTGVVPLAPSLDHVGIMADQVETVVRAFRAIAEPAAAATRDPGRRPVLGIPEGLSAVELEPAVRAAFDRSLAALSKHGFAVQPVAMRGWVPVRARKASLLVIESEAAVIYARWLDDADAPLSDRLKTFLRFGRDCGADRLAEARLELAHVRTASDLAFAQVDLLVMPTCPQVAFPFAAKPPVNQAELTALANIAGVPAISLPVATDGLPVGLQLVGPRGADERLLTVAAEVEALIGAA